MVAYASVEDFLYILIGIIWVAFSFYKAKKKKKTPDKKQGQNPIKEEPSFLDSLLDELGMDTVTPVKPQEEQPYVPYSFDDEDIIEKYKSAEYDEESQSKPTKIFSYDDIYEESNYSEATDVNVKKKSAIKSDTTIILKEKKPSGKKQKNIDLRKAVIYSEILKRQYF